MRILVEITVHDEVAAELRAVQPGAGAAAKTLLRLVKQLPRDRVGGISPSLLARKSLSADLVVRSTGYSCISPPYEPE